MAIISDAENIESAANCIMDAFKEKNIAAGSVLRYQELYPYLQEHFPKYKDVQAEAEHHLAKEAYINPAPEGLLLTPVGYTAIHGKKE